MRNLLLLILCGIVTLLASCGDEQRSDAALIAAKAYYDTLIAGNKEQFIRATWVADTIPDSYRKQLEANAAMFIGRMNEEHKGIKAVSAVNCAHDTLISNGGKDTLFTADAYLELHFGDSLKEEIVVPMIKHKGRWLMR